MAIWERIVADLLIIAVFGTGLYHAIKWAVLKNDNKSDTSDEQD